MTRLFTFPLLACSIAFAGVSQALATIPYTPVPVLPFAVGPAVPTPGSVYGKEYSHDFDHSAVLPGGLPDPEQVVLWDGIGGTTNGVDFTGTRPAGFPDQEIDAIAHSRDTLFDELLDDTAHLIFSHDDLVAGFGGPGVGYFTVPIPPSGAVPLTNGYVIGGSGEVSIEHAGAFSSPSPQTVWATAPEVNGMPLPRDVDGLEVWESEPVFDPVTATYIGSGDTDKYSLDLDVTTGVSVWNGSGTPYISHGAIVGVVTSLLGALTGTEALPFDPDISGDGVINLDALMVNDRIGDIDVFEDDGSGVGIFDSIIFSIRQVVNFADADGYYATGSELFYLNGDGSFGFVSHGGHLWDHAYTISGFSPGGPIAEGMIDINAIEAIAQVPEPAGAALLIAMMASMAAMRWRLG